MQCRRSPPPAGSAVAQESPAASGDAGGQAGPDQGARGGLAGEAVRAVGASPRAVVADHVVGGSAWRRALAGACMAPSTPQYSARSHLWHSRTGRRWHCMRGSLWARAHLRTGRPPRLQRRRWACCLKAAWVLQAMVA